MPAKALVLATLFAVQLTAAAATADNAVRQASQFIAEGKAAEAERVLRSEAFKGNTSAAAMLGALLSREGRQAEAIQILEPVASSGDAEAQWQLSGVYTRTSPPDFEKFNLWLRRAASSGSTSARIVLQDQTELKPGSDGKVSSWALAESVRSLIAAKANTFDQKTLSCYGKSRQELLAAFNISLGECFQELPADQRERVIPTQSFIQDLARCTNTRLFQRVGTSSTELLACLSK
jgi:hypothetical protein